MLSPHQNALVSLLLGSFPSSTGDAGAALAAYEIVLSGADERDTQPGIMSIIEGTFPGHDGRFAPTSAQLASAIRAARDVRLESERRDNLRRPQLPAPTIEHTPDERARVAQMTADLVARTAEQDASVKDEAAARKAMWGPVHARFQPDMSPEAVKARLMPELLGYSAGDADGDRDVA